MTIYLDCNATTPLEPSVLDAVVRYMIDEFGNAGSRTHEFGSRALEAVHVARERIARIVDASPEEIVFTSGATESNNLAILGLRAFAERVGKRHVLTTAIEHKAVLEPCERLRAAGFDVEFVVPNAGGWVEPDDIRRRLRTDTILVSVMQANNETGVSQPLSEIAECLKNHEAYFHTDAAQGFGKEMPPLRLKRIDLISISAHKIYGPKGVGALVVRRRGYQRPPLEPLLVGGGQERGLRPGTLPVPLIAGIGIAARLAAEGESARSAVNLRTREEALTALLPAGAVVNGDGGRALPHTLNISFEGIDGEALLLSWKAHVAGANGSACTSSSYTASHVLRAMGLPEWRQRGAVRLSWCHMTPRVDWNELASLVKRLR